MDKRQDGIVGQIHIAASETKLKDWLMKEYKKEKVDIIHGGNGFPDWLLVYDGKLLCFELKPIGGKTKLSDLQIKTFGELLKSNDVKVYLLKYYDADDRKIENHGVSGRDGFIERYPDEFRSIIQNIKLSKPRELTLENLKDCDNFNFDFSS